MARTYKRDSRGRFAGGSGGSSGGRKTRGTSGKASSPGASGGGRKRSKAVTTTTGTFLTRQRGKLAQQRRTKAFSSKATVGRSAREAYKAQARAARKAVKSPAVTPAKSSARQRADRLRSRAADLQQRGNALMSGGRRDGAIVNVSLSSRSRRNETSAGFRGLEMSRQAARLESRARGVEGRALQSRIKNVYAVQGKAFEAYYAKRLGKKKTEIRSAFKSQPPKTQMRMLFQFVRDNRATPARRVR